MPVGQPAAPGRPRVLLLAVALVSAGAIGYQILLMRLLSIVQWHHFAYLVISVALLGYGVSGTCLALARPWLSARFGQAFASSALAFGVTMVASFWLGQRVPFNGLALVWDPAQLWHLSVLYLLFFVPFFFAACCVGMALTCWPGGSAGRTGGGPGREERAGGERAPAAHRVYLADLLGAGAGGPVALAALFVAPAERGLALLVCLAAAAAALAWWSVLTVDARRARLGLAASALAGLAALAVPEHWLEPRISPYKGLSLAMQAVGAERLEERSSPLGLLTVVGNDTVPFRYAPGLSLAAPSGPPRQLAVFTDGDAVTAITAWSPIAPGARGPHAGVLGTGALGTGALGTDDRGTDDRGRGGPAPGGHLAYLDYLPAALPYRLLDGPRVLVLGAGGGHDVLLALHAGASAVDAVELDPQMADLVREDYAAFAGNLYRRPGVRLHVTEARTFVSGSAAGPGYDLIHLGLPGSGMAGSAGVHALGETYTHTVEAFGDYLDRLAPDGLVAVSGWLGLPPRGSLKLFATAIDALASRGVTDPSRHLAMIRSWSTVTLLIAREPLDAERVAAVREFCRSLGFDLVHVPGMAREEANRFNVLRSPFFHDGAAALLGQRESFIARYKFDVRPATDDSPYFGHFFRWRALPELMALRDAGGAALLDWSYPVLVVTVLQALVVGAVLIVGPLWLRRRRRPWRGESRGEAPAGAYFVCLGLAFLFVEMAAIQKLTLYLGHPVYAVALALGAFLSFAGLGSGCSARLAAAALGRGRDPVVLVAAGLTALALIYALALPPVAAAVAPHGSIARAVLAVAAIAPAAFLMGMPFPVGLERVGRLLPGFAPWAWGLNGLASVVSAALATLLAVHFGFTAVVLAAMGLYAAAAYVLPPEPPGPGAVRHGPRAA